MPIVLAWKAEGGLRAKARVGYKVRLPQKQNTNKPFLVSLRTELSKASPVLNLRVNLTPTMSGC